MQTRLERLLWIAAMALFAAAAPGCRQDDDPAGADELWTRIQDAKYRAWERAPGYESRKASSAPHGDQVEIFVNDVVAGALVAILVPGRQTVVERQSALPVTRFVVTPQASAPLANLGGTDVMISPDGQRIAYFGRNPENNNIALYVREIDGLEARVVPGTELANVAGGARVCSS